MTIIRVKRVYEPPDPDDGLRILVDRLWPRGLTKEKVHADLWLKDIAPSNALRNWFHHDPSMWPEFKSRYFAELELQPEVVAKLLDRAANGQITLLYAARDQEYNQAIALAEYLQLKSDQKI